MFKKLIVISVAFSILFALQNVVLAEGEFPNGPKQRKSKEEQVKDLLQSMDRQMEFYGKVIDQEGRPVEGATVYVGLRSSKGDKEITLKTDHKGRFEIKKETGFLVYVDKVKKTGYEYKYKNNPSGFDYARGKIHQPDKQNPVIFHLRKKEPPTLVLKNSFKIRFDYLGAEYELDILRGNPGPGDFTRLEKKVHIDLVVRGEVSGDESGFIITFTPLDKESGIQEKEELLYVAPERGYQPEYTYLLPFDKDAVVKKHLYMKGVGGEYYSRIDVKMRSYETSVGVYLETWTNPTGERNVEYDSTLFAEFYSKPKLERLKFFQEIRKKQYKKKIEKETKEKVKKEK